VVDNASTDDGAAFAEALLPTAIIARSETNLGLGGGCNIGLREATGDVVVFLNPDAMLTAQAIDQLVGMLAEDDIGMVGPAIVTPSGAIEHSCRRWTTAPHAFIEHLPLAERWSPTSLRRDLPPGSAIYRHGGRVAYVQGACMALRADTLRAIGGFDEDFSFLERRKASRCACFPCGSSASTFRKHKRFTSAARPSDTSAHARASISGEATSY